MKRVFLALILVLLDVSLFITPVMSQARLGDFTMRGAASQEMKNEGFVAAHASFPLASKVKVTSPRNGREIEVTVVERINPSVNRVIDLSLDAMNALGMRAGEQVVITVAAPRPASHVSIQEEPIVDLQEPSPDVQAAEIEIIEPVTVQKTATPVSSPDLVTDKTLQNPFNITVNTYVNKAGEKAADKENSVNQTEFMAWLMTMAMDAREARETKEVRENREIRESREAREAASVRESREAREAREAASVRESREAREAREIASVRESREAKEADTRRHPAPAPVQNKALLDTTPPSSETPIDKITQSSAPIKQSQPEKINTQPVPANPPAAKDESAVNNEPAVRNEPAANGNGKPVARKEPAVNSEPAVRNEPVANGNGKPAASTQTAVPQNPPAASAVTVRTVPAQAVPVYPPPVKAEDVRIIPGLPDRNSGKAYRLQIAAYSAEDAAARAAESVKAGGFEAELEYNGSIYRVLVTDIASQDVYAASIKLGSLGYGQIWVRE